MIDTSKITELIAAVKADLDALESAVNGEEQQEQQPGEAEQPIDDAVPMAGKKPNPFQKKAGGMNLMKTLGIE